MIEYRDDEFPAMTGAKMEESKIFKEKVQKAHEEAFLNDKIKQLKLEFEEMPIQKLFHECMNLYSVMTDGGDFDRTNIKLKFDLAEEIFVNRMNKTAGAEWDLKDKMYGNY